MESQPGGLAARMETDKNKLLAEADVPPSSAKPKAKPAGKRAGK